MARRSGLSCSDRPFYPLATASRQLRVLRFGLFVDGDAGIGVLHAKPPDILREDLAESEIFQERDVGLANGVGVGNALAVR